MNHTTRKYKFLSWNVRGLRSRVDDIKHYAGKHRPAVMCLQEAFPASLTSHKRIPPRISGYHAYHCKHGQGLATYVRSTIPHKLVSTSGPKSAKSTLFQLVRLQVNGASLHVCNVYARPTGLNPELLPYNPSWVSFYLGDFNAAHPSFGDAKATPAGNKLNDFISSKSIVHFPTPFSPHIGGRYLDLVLGSNLINHAVSVSIVPTLITDHNAVLTEYSVPIHYDSHLHTRTRITIPHNLQTSFTDAISTWYATYNITSAEALYNE